MLAFLKARAGEVSSILAVSGVSGFLVAWLLGQITGKQAIAGAVAAVVGYIWPETKSAMAQVVQGIGKAAPALLPFAVAAGLLTGLQACQLTGNVSADTTANLAKLQAFAPQVQAFNADAVAKIDAFNKGAITDAVAVGKAACGDAAMLDGAFQLAKPVMAAAAVDPKVAATEAGVMVGVNLGCSIIDAANPQAPGPTVAQAVTTVVAALPQLKAALSQTGSPAAEAAASAPAKQGA